MFAMRLVLALVFALAANAQVIQQHLHGKWLLKSDDEGYFDIEATVPGGVYTDLMNEGYLDDIFSNFNDVADKWVARTNWTYYRKFTVFEDLQNKSTLNLVFEGIDTYAIVFINDNEVGRTENMFVRYVFNITEYIKQGENTIEVRFLSPISVSESLAQEQEQDYVIPPQCVPDSYKGECGVQYLRKMPASFSWDWGPAFPSVGIWKEIYLEGFESTVIKYLVAEVIDAGDNWNVSVDTYFETPAKAVAGVLSYHLEQNGDPIRLTSVVIVHLPNEFGETLHSTNITFPKDSVDLWWPNGYGPQALYSLQVKFDTFTEVSSKHVDLGFRTIELAQDELDTGRSFYFRVNGVPIYAMGANVIPLDILPERSYAPETVQFLLSSAKDTGMNMLRVWGGGLYESDYFYQLADNLGILVWQDFVFASAMYPADDDFLSNVRAEVNHQVKRLQSHPSLALWCGNNENEGVLASNYFGTADNFEVYKADYIKLYIDTVKDELERITKNSLFVSSSSSNGVETEQQGYVADNPNSDMIGDMHFYDNGRDSFDVGVFPTNRFASEYGYQSLPSVSSWLTVTDNVGDLNLNSDFMKHRQHHPDGNDPLIKLINFQFELPSADNEFYDEAVIYYTQIIQAMSIKIETEYYRSFTGRLDENGRGQNMGALFWQLNDVWVAPSWSSIDYTGKWKMLQYYVPTFFSQELITSYYKHDVLTIYHVLNQEMGKGQRWVNVTVFSWDSFEPLNITQFSGELEPLTSTLVASLDLYQYLADAGCGSVDEAKNNCFLVFTAGQNETVTAPVNYFFPGKFKESNLQIANVNITSVGSLNAQNTTFSITVEADAISLFVWLDAGNIKGTFSENGFVQYQPTLIIKLVTEEPITTQDLINNLSVTHLKDPKYFS